MASDMIYLAAWSGGYEAPSYEMFYSAEAAFTKAEEWQKDMSGSDWIDVLELDPTTKTIKRLEREPFTAEGKV